MRPPSIFLSSLLVLSLICAARAQLIIYASGTKDIQGPTLTDGLIFCPTDFAKNGFNILCIASDSAKYAKFFVDGNFVRREGAKPFFIAGDKNGRIKHWTKWETYKGRDRIFTCEQSDGTVDSVTISLVCDDGSQPTMTTASATPSLSSSASPSASSAQTSQESPSASLSPSTSSEATASPSPSEGALVPGALLLHPSGTIGENFTSVTDGMTFCPDLFPYGKFTVQCVGSMTSNSAIFYVNGVKVKFEGVMPYFIAGDKGGRATAWNGYPMDESFSLSCRLSDGTISNMTLTVMCDESNEPVPSGESEEDMSGDGVTTSSSGCVVIDAKATTLSESWVERDDGVVFRPNVDGTYVAAGGLFPISYMFTVPITSQYAFIIDMTTAHGTEHNDVWAWFPAGGFQLMRGGIINEDERKGQKWTKVYHNMNGRALISSSVDFSAHSMATKEVLQEGIDYEILLSGRSSKLVVHRIIMFPCVGTGCQSASNHWGNFLDECKAY